MTNLFSTYKNYQSVKKFNLIRIEPARYANDTLVSIGGGLYTLTFKPNGTSIGVISKVQANGVTLTLVTGVPIASQYSYSETTGLLTVCSTPSSSNIICIFYYIFLTDDEGRYVTQDPEDSSTTVRYWDPKIKSPPSFPSSIENAIHGKLSTSSSSLEIISDGYDFQNYLGKYDSFYQKEMRVWLCLDSVSNIQKIFMGTISAISSTRNSVKFSMTDSLLGLNSPAYFGDTYSENYHNAITNSLLDPSKNNKPIRMMFGSITRYSSLYNPYWSSSINSVIAYFPDPNTMEEAVCIDTTTQTYGLCRSRDSFVNSSFAPSSKSYNGANGYMALYGTSGQIANWAAGDTVSWTFSGTAYTMLIAKVDYSSNFIKGYLGTDAFTIGVTVINDNYCPHLTIVQGGSIYRPHITRDYTTTISATSGGFYYLKIIFVSGFEATAELGTGTYENNSRALRTLIGTDQVFYRVRPVTTNTKHGTVAQFLIEKSGLTVNSSTFTAANTALSVNANFSVPQYDESSYGSYYSYIELLLGSALAYLEMNNSFQLEYNLFATPSGSTTLTDDDITENSFNADINYQDIVTSITARNPHFDATVVSSGASSNANVTVTSIKAQYLHGITNKIQMRHVLEDMTTRLQQILNLRSERFSRYTLDTPIKNLDTILGNDFLLQKSGILGGEASKSVKVIDIKKDHDKTSIVLSDLYNL